jgi:DNA invertase Pin-like site-specific DNA recombinase
LTRDTRFLLTLLDSGVEPVFCDMPRLTGAMGKMVLTVMVAVAELEAGLIGERTKAALAAAKARGVTLGNPNLAAIAGKGAATNRERAARYPANVLPLIAQVQRQGAVSLREIAGELTARGVKTARGSTAWSAATVGRVLARAEVRS